MTSARAMDFLEGDVLRNIALLKMLELYGESVELAFAEVGGNQGVLLRLPVAASSYDREVYPGFDTVVFVSSASPVVTGELLEGIPAQGRYVFKLMNTADRACVERRFAVSRKTAFVSYTNTPGSPYSAHPSVETTLAPDDECFALFERDGYSREWLSGMLARECAVCFVRREKDRPVSVGLAYRNFRHVWEIGGLFTREDWRRHGMARSIVETALFTLGELTPRYQVIETNSASRALATSIGLREFLVTEHLPCIAG